MKRMAASDPKSAYPKEELQRIEDGTANMMKFEIREGKKYYKIVQVEHREHDGKEWRDTSVHSFVDKNTGDVYKAASWKAPAKHVRFTFQNPEDIRFLLSPINVDWAGGYLYLR